MGRDMGTDLLDRLGTRGLSLVGVIGPDEEGLARDCAVRGVPYFPLLPEFRWPSNTLRRHLAEPGEFSAKLAQWIAPIQALDAELGVLYFRHLDPAPIAWRDPAGVGEFSPGPSSSAARFFCLRILPFCGDGKP